MASGEPSEASGDASHAPSSLSLSLPLSRTQKVALGFVLGGAAAFALYRVFTRTSLAPGLETSEEKLRENEVNIRESKEKKKKEYYKLPKGMKVLLVRDEVDLAAAVADFAEALRLDPLPVHLFSSPPSRINI